MYYLCIYMVKGKVKYKSAYDENHNLVTLTPGYKVNGKFTCPNPECKLEMIPKQGDFNSWHFAHKGKECDYDRYLHTIAELRIQEWYNKADKVNSDCDKLWLSQPAVKS